MSCDHTQHRLLVLALTLVMALAAGLARASPVPDLRILWTDDTHGYLSPLYHREEGDDRFVERAQREGRVGGFAYIAAIVNRQRAQLRDRTLLLASGDTWHGTVVPVRLAGTQVVDVMSDPMKSSLISRNAGKSRPYSITALPVTTVGS